MKVNKGQKRVGIYSSFYNNTEYDSVIKAATEAALQGLQERVWPRQIIYRNS